MANLTKLLQKYSGLILLDTETSGLDAETDQIIELAAKLSRQILDGQEVTLP